MTNDAAHRIAEAAIMLQRLTEHLRSLEGKQSATRDARRAVSDAQLQLDAAIADAEEQ